MERAPANQAEAAAAEVVASVAVGALSAGGPGSPGGTELEPPTLTKCGAGLGRALDRLLPHSCSGSGRQGTALCSEREGCMLCVCEAAGSCRQLPLSSS